MQRDIGTPRDGLELFTSLNDLLRVRMLRGMNNTACRDIEVVNGENRQ